MIESFRFLARYNRWMNERLYASAATLDDEARKLERGAFFGSIHRTLAHLVLADKIWLRRFADQGVDFASLGPSVLAMPDFTGLDQVLFEDFAEMRAHRALMDEAIEAWSLEMEDDFPARTMRYANTRGVLRSHPMWQALSHFFNHQTHHRGQITTLLVQAGVDPGVTDLIALV